MLAGIQNAGLHGVFQIGMLRHDRGLISAFVDRWRPETHTFHFSFGEATVTLEDVYYILGLRSTGHPVVTDDPIPDRHMVHSLLGVDPTEGNLHKGGLSIPWLVDHFGTCARLEVFDDDYQDELLFHIRAHVLCILGSLFPNSTGNRVQLRLLHYVRDIGAIGTYSWGSACLAYLYEQLCSGSVGRKVELCGSMTLLQVW